MKRTLFVTTLIAGVLALPVATFAQPGPGYGQGPGAAKGPGPGAGQGPGPGKGPMRGGWIRERLFGSPLMTLEERQAHQRQMWDAKTLADRQKIRDEHRKQMLDRAKQRNAKINPGQDDVFSVPAVPAK
jgi:hypothetical protein